MEVVEVFVGTVWNYDRDKASKETGLDTSDDPVYTQQSFKEECDINEIVRRFGLTGQLPENVRVPVSGDFTDVHDFKTAMDAVTAAQASFMELPAELRYRFANDPQRLLEFCADAENREEAIKLGLVEKPAERTRDVIQAVDELAAKMNITPPSSPGVK